MKKISAVSIFLVIVSVLSFSAEKNSKPVLRFNPDGKFKIVQFTDIHFQYNSYRSDSALILMGKIIDLERPDLVILTGDIVCSNNTKLAWISLSKVMIEAKVPWAVTFGNHDRDFELTGEQIIKMIADFPYNLTVNGPENNSGNGNYLLNILSSKASKTSALIYCFDSHNGLDSKLQLTDLGIWKWINFDQIEWYRKLSGKITKRNGGVPIPSLAFFHIPLPEYREFTGGKAIVGIQKETVASYGRTGPDISLLSAMSPDINSGLFAAMIESKDVMGIFVGHNHNNNYIGCLKNICLAYGNVSGRQCYGDIGRGARVIELYEGERKFDSWILKLYECNRDSDTWMPTKDLKPKFFVTYPDSFINKE